MCQRRNRDFLQDERKIQKPITQSSPSVIISEIMGTLQHREHGEVRRNPFGLSLCSQ